MPEKLIAALKDRGWLAATAESCTGGMVASAITSISGSSAVFDCGFVTYSNLAKSRILGVPPEMILKHGAVSEEVARAMALGAIAKSAADIAVSITGIAGPTGGTSEKPVGLVHFASATRSGLQKHQEMRFGDIGRHEIRARAVRTALDLMLDQTRL